MEEIACANRIRSTWLTMYSDWEKFQLCFSVEIHEPPPAGLQNTFSLSFLQKKGPISKQGVALWPRTPCIPYVFHDPKKS